MWQGALDLRSGIECILKGRLKEGSFSRVYRESEATYSRRAAEGYTQ